MSKYTTGPWKLGRNDPEQVYAANGKLIAETYAAADNNRIALRSEREANARLIAAAPELLELLKECADHLYEKGYGLSFQLANKALTFITEVEESKQ